MIQSWQTANWQGLPVKDFLAALDGEEAKQPAKVMATDDLMTVMAQWRIAQAMSAMHTPAT